MKIFIMILMFIASVYAMGVIVEDWKKEKSVLRPRPNYFSVSAIAIAFDIAGVLLMLIGA